MKATAAIIMGSASDFGIMKDAKDLLESFEITVHVEVVSAHRTPEKMVAFAKNAEEQGFKVIIAGAGGAAHLPGMVASLTPLPVIGVPIKSCNSMDGWDSVLSILLMPNGIPVEVRPTSITTLKWIKSRFIAFNKSKARIAA